MTMRLLAKSDITKAKANEQRQTIDEGVKLAKRIDNLREVVATEEEKLEQFRSETVSAIYKDIRKAEVKRDALFVEIGKLQSELKIMRLPLDAEWDEVRKEQKDIEFQRSEITNKLKLVNDAEKHAEYLVKEAKTVDVIANTRNDVAKKLLKEAEAKHEEAEETLDRARKADNEATVLYEKMMKELTHRDMECATRERGVTMKEEQLNARETELANGWRLLEDRKATLERSLSKLKQ
jgi:mRNA-degrading endonuclease YafQ of YafQ-DinJ toxin-antitoxin module